MLSARLHLHPLPTISVIVPVHNRLAELEECLESLQSWRPEGCELILVDDASTEDASKIAERYGALYFRTQRQEGPASARNLGAHHASGDILVFVDADVVVSAETFNIIRGEFHHHPDLAALFGSYDDEPRYTDFFSSFKNLLHHHVHQASRSEAVTFWSGCGAIRKRAFESVGGFNAAQYPTPSIEDIELGIRLIQQGERVRLIKGLQVKHLKKWTLGSLVRTDVFQRAIPWTQLILQTGRMPQDLNLTWTSRLSTALVAAIAVVTLDLAAKAHGLSRWSLRDLAAIFLFTSILLVLNLDLYRLFWRKRGVRFTVRAIGIHWAYFLYSGAAFLFCCVAGPFRAPVRPPAANLDLNVLAKTRINKRP